MYHSIIVRVVVPRTVPTGVEITIKTAHYDGTDNRYRCIGQDKRRVLETATHDVTDLRKRDALPSSTKENKNKKCGSIYLLLPSYCCLLLYCCLCIIIIIIYHPTGCELTSGTTPATPYASVPLINSSAYRCHSSQQAQQSTLIIKLARFDKIYNLNCRPPIPTRSVAKDDDGINHGQHRRRMMNATHQLQTPDTPKRPEGSKLQQSVTLKLETGERRTVSSLPPPFLVVPIGRLKSNTSTYMP